MHVVVNVPAAARLLGIDRADAYQSVGRGVLPGPWLELRKSAAAAELPRALAR